MEQVKLVFPSPKMEHQAQSYIQDFYNNGETAIYGAGGLGRFKTYNEWLEKIKDETTWNNSGLVPATTYFAVVGDYIVTNSFRIVGTIQIRHKLNDKLLVIGGNIGYAVRPSDRRKGFASKMLALALGKCRELGMEKALVTCDSDNIGSARTILKNGGILENQLPRDDGKITQRYWITIK
jgi:predicted acetyltransferase